MPFGQALEVQKAVQKSRGAIEVSWRESSVYLMNSLISSARQQTLDEGPLVLLLLLNPFPES